jgi:hypothetical protein
MVDRKVGSEGRVEDEKAIRESVAMVVSGSVEPLLKRSGHTLSILRKQPDGRWLLARDANLMGMTIQST